MPRIALFVVLGIAALAVFVSARSSSELARAHRLAAEEQLRSIAATMDDGFRMSDLNHADRLQRRIARLKTKVPNLHKISISWINREGETLLLQAGHEHDPDGTKRDITSMRVLTNAPGSAPAPIEQRRWGYRQVEAADGAHYGELEIPVMRFGGAREVAAFELHYDLRSSDAALAEAKQEIALAATIAAVLLALLLTTFLRRAVLRPLSKLRDATNRIRYGEKAIKLGWRRRDEIGALANDFDRMAEELQEALKDSLTGLYNHRAFQERVGEELRRAERERYPVSIVAIDIDDFKQLNDRGGHAVGDEALRRVAAALRDAVRPSDVCGRVGGDEFMVALVRSNLEWAEQVVERLRNAVADLRVGPTHECITLSAGISEFPRHALAQEELLHLADGAMYWAKSTGKNRTLVYSSESDLALSAEEAAQKNLKVGLVKTVHALAKAVDAKDGYTHSHSQRVARYATVLGERLGLSGDQLESLRTAGVLHDVGKIGIPDGILLSPRRLTEDEFAEMRRHSELGRDIIAGAGMDDVASWVLHLHERYDGAGYPFGLVGEDIPMESRILHAADALEAMTSSRVYRNALPLDAALAELEAGLGTQFDPQVGQLLIELVKSGDLTIGDDIPLAAPAPRAAAA